MGELRILSQDLSSGTSMNLRSSFHLFAIIILSSGLAKLRTFASPSHNGAKLCVGKYFLNQNNVSCNDATCMYYLLIYKDIDYRIPLYIPCLGSAWIYFVILVTSGYFTKSLHGRTGESAAAQQQRGR